MKILYGKTALITGATRGIGNAIAMRFAQEGANVAFTYVTKNERCAIVEKELAELGVKAIGFASNAADFSDTQRVVNEVVKEFGKIDILVNNAGITKDGLMIRMSEQQWDDVININLKSAYNFIHACSSIMLRQKSGNILSVSSVVGLHGNIGQANYAASKAGMIGITKSIAQEFGSRGIRANAIAPGFIITEMTGELDPKYIDAWSAKIPLKRGGTVKEVADVALFLVSDASSYITGQVIQIDGGMFM
ncbi:MAG TPA: 3-oxoacyl-[acyl-carrier-protein] reductase [Bacteroidaceae bacterium]|nr:3-oxoacyl-[acyl-carrier-protein] reductase [Bacteroidaceae bacterium]